jgi:tetratricopeptide (TPR) repeat protein
MKCIYCGEELKEGSLFCSHCGKAAQIVPDYNVYEDDYLKQVLAEENSSVKPDHPLPNNASGSAEPAGARQEKNAREQKKKQTKIILCVVGIVCVLVFALLVLGAAIRTNHANSFDYQVELAQKAYDKGDLEQAIAYYENALALDNKNVDVRLTLAGIYMEQKDYDSALVLYQEVLRIDKENREATKNLIAIYEEQENVDAILALQNAVDDSLLDLFADYVVSVPEFSLEEGTFEEEQTLQLSSDKGYHIYYTLDGTDPVTKGTVYTSPIELTENNKVYTVKAVCMNDKQIYSDVVSRTYQIDIPAPDTPIVTPDGGDFGVETTVTITVPDGCSAYYTWDGTTPDGSSNRYSEPIMIPEGNNILAVIIYDNKTKLFSDVYRGNFVYYAEDYSDEGVE